MPSRSSRRVSFNFPRMTVALARGSSYEDRRRQSANFGFGTRSKMITSFLVLCGGHDGGDDTADYRHEGKDHCACCEAIPTATAISHYIVLSIDGQNGSLEPKPGAGFPLYGAVLEHNPCKAAGLPREASARLRGSIVRLTSRHGVG